MPWDTEAELPRKGEGQQRVSVQCCSQGPNQQLSQPCVSGSCITPSLSLSSQSHWHLLHRPHIFLKYHEAAAPWGSASLLQWRWSCPSIRGLANSIALVLCRWVLTVSPFVACAGTKKSRCFVFSVSLVALPLLLIIKATHSYCG